MSDRKKKWLFSEFYPYVIHSYAKEAFSNKRSHLICLSIKLKVQYNRVISTIDLQVTVMTWLFRHDNTFKLNMDWNFLRKHLQSPLWPGNFKSIRFKTFFFLEMASLGMELTLVRGQDRGYLVNILRFIIYPDIGFFTQPTTFDGIIISGRAVSISGRKVSF